MYDLSKQFEFAPSIENGKNFDVKKFSSFVVVGMGGSHVASGLVNMVAPRLDLVSWSDYGLPERASYAETLVIASSHSGDTEETISAFHEAKRRGIPVLIIASGGELLKIAESEGVPHIKLPNPDHLAPRNALGYSFLAFLKSTGQEELLRESRRLASTLDSKQWDKEGDALAHSLRGFVPIIYVSTVNGPLGYIWKIKLNETGKIPAVCNVFPEMNHNELTSFSDAEGLRALSRMFHPVFIRDKEDHPRVAHRMDITKKIFEDMHMPVEEVRLAGENRLHAIFSSILLADATAFALARLYGSDPEAIPLVDRLKREMK